MSSILRACNVCCKHQTGDCKERIEKFNITHLHHLRSCTLLRRKTTRRPYLPTRIIITQNTGKYNQYRPSPIAFTTSYGAFFRLCVHEKRPRRISPSRSFTMRFRLAVFAKIAMDSCAPGHRAKTLLDHIIPDQTSICNILQCVTIISEAY